MLNIKPPKEKTEAGDNLTVEDVRQIVSAREQETLSDVERLLNIIDRITGTCWTVNG